MWTPPAKTAPITPTVATRLRQIVKNAYPLALEVRLALNVDGPAATQTLSQARLKQLENAAIELYRFIPVSAVPLTTAQAWIDGGRWTGTPPILDDGDRLGWPTFANRDGLLATINRLAPPAAKVQPLKLTPLSPTKQAKPMTPADIVFAGIQPNPMAALGDVVEQTKIYRADRLALWEAIRANHAKYYDDARKANATAADAMAAADKHVRDEIRLFIMGSDTKAINPKSSLIFSDPLVNHVPATDYVEFMLAAPKTWGFNTELLLVDDIHGKGLVRKLIDKSLPYAQWAKEQDAINKLNADAVKQDNLWRSALEKTFNLAANGLSGAGGIVVKATDTAFGVIEDVGEGAGDLLKGGGKGLQGVGEGLGTGVKILLGVVGVGAAVGIALYLKNKK